MTPQWTSEHEQVLDAEEVAAKVAAAGVDGEDGTRRTVLWEHAGSTAGVLELSAGARMGEHTHRDHAHHVWVIEGQASVQGRTLDPGAYWFVPPGRPHTLEATGPAGCRLFYVYLRTTPQVGA